MQNATSVQRIVELTLKTIADTKGIDQFAKSAENAGNAATQSGVEANKAAKGFDNYEKEVTQSTRATGRFRQGLARGRQNLTRFREGLRQTRQESTRTSRAIGNLARTAVAGFGFAVAARNARDFSLQIAEVATLVDTTIVPQEQLAESVRNLSDTFGVGTEEAAQGLYQAISSGAVDAAESNEFMNTALRLATAGVTDAQTAVNGLTTVLNAFNIPAERAGEVSDVLFATVRAGKTDLEELSGFIFQAAPLAASLGVSFQEVNAALIGLTASGTPTRVAFTQVRAAMQGVIKPTEDLQAIFQAAGFASGEAAIRAEGLQGALEILQEATGGSASQLIELLGSVEAVQGVLGLTGANAERFAGAMDAVNDAAGATDEAFEKVDDTLSKVSSQTFEQLNNALADIGRAFEPVIRAGLALIRAFASVVRFFTTEFPTASKVVVTALTALLIVRTVTRSFGLLNKALELAGFSQIKFATATTAATAAERGQILATNLLRIALSKLTVGIGALILGYEAAGFAIDSLVDRNNRAIANLRRTTDITREILALRERAEAAGADPAELESEILALQARAFRPGTSENQREAILADVRDILLERVEQAEELTGKIEQEEQRITQIKQQEAQNQRRIFQQNIVDRQEAAIAAARVELSETRRKVREQERLEKESIERRKAILQESADFQKGINEEIAAATAELLGIEGPSEEVEQAQRTLQIRQQLADLERQRATVIDSATAEEIQNDVQKLQAEAEKVESAAQRLLFLREIAQLEQQVAERGAGLARLEADTAAQDAETLTTSIQDQTVAVKQLNEALKESKKALEDLPPLEITADISDVQQKVEILERRLRDLQNTRIVVTAQVQQTNATGGRLQAFGSGGSVKAGRRIPGYGGGDRTSFLGEKGEWVINKRRSSEFNSLLGAVNFGSRKQIQSMINAMAGLPAFQSGGTLGTGIASGALTQASPREQITQRVQLDLTSSGTPIGSLFGEETVVDNLIDKLRDTRRGVVRR